MVQLINFYNVLFNVSAAPKITRNRSENCLHKINHNIYNNILNNNESMDNIVLKMTNFEYITYNNIGKGLYLFTETPEVINYYFLHHFKSPHYVRLKS